MASFEFKPFPLIKGSHKQTIFASIFSFYRNPSSTTKLVKLPDNDSIALEVTTPKKWKPTDPTIVMVHGLCGSHKSPYLIRLVKKFSKKGMRCVRLNLRGCGTGQGHSKGIYHSGCSEDVGVALMQLKEEHPDSPLVLMGFSLGGNIILKLGGELAAAAKPLITSIIAVSPPVDLFASVKMLRDPENRIYERYFLKLLLEYVDYRHKRFPDLPKVTFPEDCSLYDLDEKYIAPHCGYRSVMEYYTMCSSRTLIPRIYVPTKILFSEDDPLIDSKSLDDMRLPTNVEVFKTKTGGHLGFLGMPGTEGGFRWMDNLILKWVKQLFSST